MCHDNEEWCKIWRGIDLPFQNWHGEFDKFWLEHLEVSKMFTLMCSFWAEYILFELKKYRGVIFHDTEEWYKIWRGIDMSFQNWHGEFDKFWPKHLKISKILTLMGSFWAEYMLFGAKKVQRSYLSWHWRVIQNWETNRLVVLKLTWGIWQIFTRALESVKIGTLMGSFCPK